MEANRRGFFRTCFAGIAGAVASVTAPHKEEPCMKFVDVAATEEQIERTGKAIAVEVARARAEFDTLVDVCRRFPALKLNDVSKFSRSQIRALMEPARATLAEVLALREADNGSTG